MPIAEENLYGPTRAALTMASLTVLPIDMLLPVMLALIIRDDEVSVSGSIKALATVGRLLATSKLFGASTAARDVIWRTAAALLFQPLLPLLSHRANPTKALLERVVSQVRFRSGQDRMIYNGRQCEAGPNGGYAQHDFTLSMPRDLEFSSTPADLEHGYIRWRCTYSVNGVNPPMLGKWCLEALKVTECAWPVCKFRSCISRERGVCSPTEYTFECRHNGLLIVLVGAKLLQTDEPPLRQKGWGLLKMQSLLRPRKDVDPCDWAL